MQPGLLRDQLKEIPRGSGVHAILGEIERRPVEHAPGFRDRVRPYPITLLLGEIRGTAGAPGDLVQIETILFE